MGGVDLATLALAVDSTGFVTGLRQASDATDHFAGRVQNVQPAMTGMDRAVMGLWARFKQLATMVGVGWSFAQIASLGKEVVLLAARYSTLGVVIERLRLNIGASAAAMKDAEEGLKKTGISAIESRQQIIAMIQAQIDLSHATKLARLAQDAAVIGNMNSSDAFARVIHGLRTGQTEVLRMLGLQVNFTAALRAHAAQLGKNVETLSAEEKMQARVNAVMAAGVQITGAYEAAMTDAGKLLKSTERFADDMKVAIGAAFKPEFTEGVNAYSNALKSASQWVKTHTEQLRQAVELLKDMARALGIIITLYATWKLFIVAVNGALAATKMVNVAMDFANAELAITGATGAAKGLTVAWHLMHAAASKLWGLMKLHPYIAIGAAVLALGTILWKLTKAHDDAAAAAARHAAKLREMETNAQNASVTIYRWASQNPREAVEWAKNLAESFVLLRTQVEVMGRDPKNWFGSGLANLQAMRKELEAIGTILGSAVRGAAASPEPDAGALERQKRIEAGQKAYAELEAAQARTAAQSLRLRDAVALQSVSLRESVNAIQAVREAIEDENAALSAGEQFWAADQQRRGIAEDDRVALVVALDSTNRAIRAQAQAFYEKGQAEAASNRATEESVAVVGAQWEALHASTDAAAAYADTMARVAAVLSGGAPALERVVTAQELLDRQIALGAADWKVYQLTTGTAAERTMTLEQAFRNGIPAALEITQRWKNAAEAIKTLSDAMKEAERNEWFRSIAEGIADTQRLIDAAAGGADMLQRAQDAIALERALVEVRKKFADANTQAQRAAELQVRTQHQLNRTLAERVTAIDKAAAKEEEARQKSLEPWISALRSMQDQFAKTFEEMFAQGKNAFANFANAVLGIFKKLVAQIAALFVIKSLGLDKLLDQITNMGKRNEGAGPQFTKEFQQAAMRAGVSLAPIPAGTTKGFSLGALAGKLTPMSGAMSGLGGAAIGYGTGSPVIGGLGGAAMGFLAGGPIGAAIGAITGVIGGFIGSAQKARQAAKALNDARDAFTKSLASWTEVLYATGSVESMAAQARAIKAEGHKLEVERRNAETKGEREAIKAMGGWEAFMAASVESLEAWNPALAKYRQQIDDLNAATVRRIEIMQREQELTQAQITPALEARALAAQGQAFAAKQIEMELRFERENFEAWKNNYTAIQREKLAYAQAAERAAFEAEKARTAQQFRDQLASRQAALAGDNETIIRLRAAAAYRDEMEAAQRLADQGLITAEEVTALADVLAGELAAALKELAHQQAQAVGSFQQEVLQAQMVRLKPGTEAYNTKAQQLLAGQLDLDIAQKIFEYQKLVDAGLIAQSALDDFAATLRENATKAIEEFAYAASGAATGMTDAAAQLISSMSGLATQALQIMGATAEEQMAYNQGIAATNPVLAGIMGNLTGQAAADAIGAWFRDNFPNPQALAAMSDADRASWENMITAVQPFLQSVAAFAQAGGVEGAIARTGTSQNQSVKDITGLSEQTGLRLDSRLFSVTFILRESHSVLRQIEQNTRTSGGTVVVVQQPTSQISDDRIVSIVDVGQDRKVSNFNNASGVRPSV